MTETQIINIHVLSTLLTLILPFPPAKFGALPILQECPHWTNPILTFEEVKLLNYLDGLLITLTFVWLALILSCTIWQFPTPSDQIWLQRSSEWLKRYVTILSRNEINEYLDCQLFTFSLHIGTYPLLHHLAVQSANPCQCNGINL